MKKKSTGNRQIIGRYFITHIYKYGVTRLKSEYTVSMGKDVQVLDISYDSDSLYIYALFDENPEVSVMSLEPGIEGDRHNVRLRFIPHFSMETWSREGFDSDEWSYATSLLINEIKYHVLVSRDTPLKWARHAPSYLL